MRPPGDRRDQDAEKPQQIANLLFGQLVHMEDDFIEQDQHRHGLWQQRIDRGIVGTSRRRVERAKGVERARAAELEGELGREAPGLLIAMAGEDRVTGPFAVDPDDANLGGSSCRRQQMSAHRRVRDVPGEMPQRHQRVRLAAPKSGR
ncbi:MAG: hypothetical protein ACREFP_16155 [Acetobacteraceae bacterium]